MNHRGTEDREAGGNAPIMSLFSLSVPLWFNPRLLRHRIRAADDLGAGAGGVEEPEEAVAGGGVNGLLGGGTGRLDFLHQAIELAERDAEGEMVRRVHRPLVVEEELDP